MDHPQCNGAVAGVVDRKRMALRTVLGMALGGLRRNRLRTGLTMAGLVIGVAAVIAIVALGAGARAAIERQVSAAGTNLVIVSAGNWTAGGVRLGMGSSSRLTAADVAAIRAEVPGVAAVSAQVRSRQQLINGRQNWSASVEGVGAELLRVRQWALAAGTFFTREHVAGAERVCVLGAGVRQRLFEPGVSPLGRQIRIGAHIFRVLGVLAPKGQSSGGQDQDDAVFVPFTTAQKKLMGVSYLRNIYVSAARADDVARVADDIRRVIRRRHAIAAGQPDDFRVRTLEEIVAMRGRTVQTMTALMSGVAAVSLLVGGIGVMNIMLVSVTERTREIGIRLAVGARARDVGRQFLTEAIVLSGSGGVLGIVAGVLAAKLLTGVFGWATDLSTTVTILAFVTAALTGVFFGWYPARRASGTDPIEALRHE
jgi:putative ABC transport system permease protein